MSIHPVLGGAAAGKAALGRAIRSLATGACDRAKVQQWDMEKPYAPGLRTEAPAHRDVKALLRAIPREYSREHGRAAAAGTPPVCASSPRNRRAWRTAAIRGSWVFTTWRTAPGRRNEPRVLPQRMGLPSSRWWSRPHPAIGAGAKRLFDTRGKRPDDRLHRSATQDRLGDDCPGRPREEPRCPRLGEPRCLRPRRRSTTCTPAARSLAGERRHHRARVDPRWCTSIYTSIPTACWSGSAARRACSPRRRRSARPTASCDPAPRLRKLGSGQFYKPIKPGVTRLIAVRILSTGLFAASASRASLPSSCRCSRRPSSRLGLRQTPRRLGLRTPIPPHGTTRRAT